MTQKEVLACNLKKKFSLRAWLLATRPRTLSISFMPLFLGTALASKQIESINWQIVLSLFLSVPWIQIGMNLINDALDYKKGELNTESFGFQRIKLLKPQQFLIGGYLSFAFAFLFGIPVIIAGGWPFFFLFLLSILLGYLYSGGPFPLSYKGISDIFILIFYGWMSTSATFYLLTGYIEVLCLITGTQIGLLAIVPHAINNLRDHVSDAIVNKRTLAVRFGTHFVRWEITLCFLIPFFFGLFLLENHYWMAVLPLFILPVIICNIRKIWQNDPSPLYNQFIANSALCQLSFTALLIIATFIE